MNANTSISSYDRMADDQLINEYQEAKEFEPEGVNEADRKASEQANNRKIEAIELIMVDRGMLVDSSELISERAREYIKVLSAHRPEDIHPEVAELEKRLGLI